LQISIATPYLETETSKQLDIACALFAILPGSLLLRAAVPRLRQLL
jgi:hypothetical protein